ncbi:hypothetical protein F0562_019946 [Nyssa sinensis]|uniref:Uncharacterized protein n=1 Tax=Nyssa sinensis TaxID=561372 RepID=A0A5J5BRD9_9ASTE|nr:hypothetical protein F0562_019946 [Nyssa sinensis]
MAYIEETEMVEEVGLSKGYYFLSKMEVGMVVEEFPTGGFGGLGGDDERTLFGVWLDPEEKSEFLGDDKFGNIEEFKALDEIRIEQEEELHGAWGGYGLVCTFCSRLQGEMAAGVGDGIAKFIGEVTEQGDSFDTFREMISDVSLRLPTEALESRLLDECEGLLCTFCSRLQGAWKGYKCKSEARVEMEAGVGDGIAKFIGEFTEQVDIFDTVREMISDVSLKLPAEASESHLLDECEGLLCTFCSRLQGAWEGYVCKSEARVEMEAGVGDGIAKFIGEVTEQGDRFDMFRKMISDVSLRLTAEALESRLLDECESQRE